MVTKFRSGVENLGDFGNDIPGKLGEIFGKPGKKLGNNNLQLCTKDISS